MSDWQKDKRIRIYQSLRDDGGLQLWSPDVVEFYLSGKVHPFVRADVPIVLKTILSWNYGLEFDDFEIVMETSVRDIAERQLIFATCPPSQPTGE